MAAFLLSSPDDPDYKRPPGMTRTEKDEPRYTEEQEITMMEEQINESEGFDIDFSLFRCIFCYHSAYLDSHEFVDEPETTGDLLKRLSQTSLDDYNAKKETAYEFVKVVKANFYAASGIVFLITFEVVDPYDDMIKPFQARVRHLKNTFTEYILCRPKPNHGVEYFGIVKKDVKKQIRIN